MPAPGSAASALTDIVVRETIDLHSRVIASMSDKIDAQGEVQAKFVDTVLTAMEATRNAAVVAKQQTDPARYARHIEQELDKTIGRILDRLDVQHSNFEADRRDVAYRLEELVLQEENVLQRLRADLESAGRWKRRIPFIALFGLVLALGLTIALPRFLAVNAAGCAALGGSWTRSTTDVQVCVFYAG